MLPFLLFLEAGAHKDYFALLQGKSPIWIISSYSPRAIIHGISLACECTCSISPTPHRYLISFHGLVNFFIPVLRIAVAEGLATLDVHRG
jgi:hypothetical protein